MVAVIKKLLSFGSQESQNYIIFSGENMNSKLLLTYRKECSLLIDPWAIKKKLNNTSAQCYKEAFTSLWKIECRNKNEIGSIIKERVKNCFILLHQYFGGGTIPKLCNYLLIKN